MSLNDIADFQRKIHDFQMDVTRHLEMMAAAYMKATDIPPEECELIVEMLPDKMVYRFQRRRTPRALDGACESCKLELTPSCPIRTGNGCDLYQPRQ
jgi:hypothetical protein